VKIRWKAKKYSYNLKVLEIFLNEEILDLFWQNSIISEQEITLSSTIMIKHFFFPFFFLAKTTIS